MPEANQTNVKLGPMFKLAIAITLSWVLVCGQVAATGSTPEPLTPTFRYADDFQVSADENFMVSMAYDTSYSLREVFSVHIPTGTVRKLHTPVSGETIRFTITPDSSSVLIYGADYDRKHEIASPRIITIPINGGQELVLASNNNQISGSNTDLHPKITMDGDYLVYISGELGSLFLRSIDLNTNQVIELNSGDSIRDGGYHISNDNRIVYVDSLSGNLISQSLDGSSKITLSTPTTEESALYIGLISMDSNFVIYQKRANNSENELLSIPINGGEPNQLAATQENIGFVKLSQDGSRIVYATEGIGVRRLFSVRVNGDDNTELINSHEIDTPTINYRLGIVDFTISPDSELVVFNIYQLDIEAAPYDHKIYSIDIDGGTPSQLNSGVTASILPRVDYTQDGQHVLFYTPFSSSISSIYISPIDGSSAPEVIHSVDTPSFTPKSNEERTRIAYLGDHIPTFGHPISVSSIRDRASRNDKPTIFKHELASNESVLRDFYYAKNDDFIIYTVLNHEDRSKTRIYIRTIFEDERNPIYIKRVRLGSSNTDLQNKGYSNFAQPILRIQFSRDAKDPEGDGLYNDDVTDKSLYHVIHASEDQLIENYTGNGCLMGIQGDDQAIEINNTQYTTRTKTVRLDINSGNILPAGKYALLVCGSTAPSAISDNDDTPLDGNADGSGGDDFALIFTIGDSDALCFPLAPESNRVTTICI